LKDRLFNQKFGRQRCRSGDHGYSVTLILSYIFVTIMLLYAIANLIYSQRELTHANVKLNVS